MRLEFEKGDLDAAFKDVEALSKRAANAGDDWLWRVRLLEAEILVWRGLNDQVLPLLEPNVPGNLSSRDYAARRLIFLGLAQGHAHRFDESAQSFNLAEELALTTHPEVLGDIYLARGSIQVDQGLYEDALNSYQAALRKARDFKQPFLEANATGSLGYASTWLERYDQAIDWYKLSLASSDSFGARTTSAKTLGNLGWSYHELGNLKDALQHFEDARRLSKQAGLQVDEGYWQLSAGSVKFDQGDYAEARADMLESLRIAQSLHDSSTATECFQNLTLVAIREKQFAEAHRLLDQAIESNSNSHDFKSEQYIQLLGAQLALKERQFDSAARQFSALIGDKRTPTAVHWEAQAGLATAYGGLGKLAQAEAEYKRAIATIAAAQDSIKHDESSVSFLSSAIRFYDEYVNFLLSQHRTLDALNLADRSRAQTLEHGLSLKSSSKNNQEIAVTSLHLKEIARNQKDT